MRILGIDPGLDTTGYGIIEDSGDRFKLLEAGIIQTSPRQAIQKRLTKIYRGISALIKQYRPKALAIEKLYSHYKHPTTVILMGHSRGVVCLAAGETNIPLISYPAKRIKKALTGNGSASKYQVQRMVQGIFGLSEAKIPDDVTDALAVAITHSYISKSSISQYKF